MAEKKKATSTASKKVEDKSANDSKADKPKADVNLSSDKEVKSTDTKVAKEEKASKPKAEEAKTETKVEQTPPKELKTSVKIPTVEEMLEAGVQFGHQTQRWNPKMKNYIFGAKEKIHVIDLYKTQEMLEKAAAFLEDAASKGEIVFVGTKKQASKIVQNAAIDSGAYFVTVRWAGGLLSNFKMIKKSLDKLRDLETQFEKGIAGRTKFEISRMKKEWARMNRLYSGIKTMSSKPTAVVVVDAKFELNAVREAQVLGIPVVAMVDTNTDPESVEYPIPANDDALGSIELVINTLGKAVEAGNKGKGVKHFLKDYTDFEVQILKPEDEEVDLLVETSTVDAPTDSKTKSKPRKIKKIKRVVKKADKGKTKKSGGILEGVQKAKETN